MVPAHRGGGQTPASLRVGATFKIKTTGICFYPKTNLSALISTIVSIVLNRHSATLLSNKLLIFGGRKTATYLNDVHILDLGKIRVNGLHLVIILST